MTSIVRLVTFVDVNDVGPSSLSFSARHDALLADGRRIVLLNDRGWTQSRHYYSYGDDPPPMPEAVRSPWDGVTREDIEESARSVVGPDSAYREYTQTEMDEAHWEHLSAALERQGVDVSATDVTALPHAVELSDRLLARLDNPHC